MDAAQIAAMIADREAGTPGPWKSAKADMTEGVFSWWIFAPKYGALGYTTGHKQRHNGVRSWLLTEFDARRIASVPDMEAHIIAQAAELERLRAALDVYEDALTEAEAIFGGEYGDHYGPMCELAFAARDARAALKGGAACS